MAEPRARQRQKGQQFKAEELSAFLYAFGDDRDPLPETVKVLDEIVTDYIIEACHSAAEAAAYAHRAKIKVEDFKWMLRRDPKKLGRAIELLKSNKEIQEKRKMLNAEDEMALAAKQAGVTKRGRKSKKEKERLERMKKGVEGKDEEGDGGDGADGEGDVDDEMDMGDD